MVVGLDRVLYNLNNIKKAQKDIDNLFIEKSLKWIAEKANKNLDKAINEPPHFWGSSARVWVTRIKGNVGILENMDDNSASIEFGIGKAGTEFSEIVWVARQNGWEYDLPSEHKDEDGNWTFQDEHTGIWVKNFNGYKGKSFLYNSFIEYKDTYVWKKLYQEAVDEVIRRVVK